MTKIKIELEIEVPTGYTVTKSQFSDWVKIKLGLIKYMQANNPLANIDLERGIVNYNLKFIKK
jgi:hypothetical protein